MRSPILIFFIFFPIISLYSQTNRGEKATSFFVTSNYQNKAMCQFDTLLLEAHFIDATYLHPFFCWESKMPNEAWHTEIRDTFRTWQVSPLTKGKAYRCIVDDSISSEGLTFRKRISEVVQPIANPFPDITIVPETATCLLPNGKINVYTNWDTKNLKFFWTDKSQKQHLTGVLAGEYSVVILDTKTGCKRRFTDSVHNEYVPPSLFINTRYAECGLNNGAIDLSVAGNDGPFSYKWNTGAETEDLQRVGVGVYRVAVSNSVGCVTTEKVAISNIPSPFRIHLNSQDAACNLPNGKILCQVEGSGAPFKYLWNTGIKIDSIKNCKSGSYFVAVTNQYGCIDTAFAQIKQKEMPKITFEVQAVDCYKASTGRILTHISEENAYYQYLWNNGSESKDLLNVPADIYRLLVKNDLENCEIQAEVRLAEAPFWEISPEIQTVNGTFQLLINPKGGTVPYTYLWADGKTTNPWETSEMGIYGVKVTDAKGCSLSDSIELSHNEAENMYIPNFITPNSDGRNDDFSIQGENILKISVVISDSLGNVMYEETYKEIHWDASQCGESDCYEGFYNYEAVIYYTNGKVQERKGRFFVYK